ncbi:Peptidyl-tRNA hydrolase [uncultured archaeon]|nr:Peptidyl-tRNA hydrolase [uncultured archaeon]
MEFKQAIIVRHDLGMGRGKAAAQSSHASLEAYEKALKKEPEWVKAWKESGQTKVVLKVNSEKELLEIFERARKILPSALIHDAGRTQIEAGSATCVAIGPGPSSEIDKITKELKLL